MVTGGQVARAVAASRIEELQRWLDKARDAAESSSLYELEADFQIVEVLAHTTAEQLLRVLQASGLMRSSAGGLFARDDVSEMRQKLIEEGIPAES